MKQDRQGQAGFTLMELVIVMVLIGIVSAYVLVLNANTSALTARSQADKLAADLRHAQALAMSWGVNLQVTTSGATYSVTCTSGSTNNPCPAGSPITDPATNLPFSTTLANNTTFTATPASAISFNSQGNPGLAGGAYQISGGGSTFTVTVAPTTGTVSVAAP